MYVTVGTCSICRGRVEVPEAWGSIIPPVPECVNCGARKAPDYGPIITMNPRPYINHTRFINGVRSAWREYRD